MGYFGLRADIATLDRRAESAYRLGQRRTHLHYSARVLALQYRLLMSTGRIQ